MVAIAMLMQALNVLPYQMTPAQVAVACSICMALLVLLLSCVSYQNGKQGR